MEMELSCPPVNIKEENCGSGGRTPNIVWHYITLKSLTPQTNTTYSTFHHATSKETSGWRLLAFRGLSFLKTLFTISLSKLFPNLEGFSTKTNKQINKILNLYI